MPNSREYLGIEGHTKRYVGLVETVEYKIQNYMGRLDLISCNMCTVAEIEFTDDVDNRMKSVTRSQQYLKLH